MESWALLPELWAKGDHRKVTQENREPFVFKTLSRIKKKDSVSYILVVV